MKTLPCMGEFEFTSTLQQVHKTVEYTGQESPLFFPLNMSHCLSRNENFTLRTKTDWIPSRHRNLTALHFSLCYQWIEECLSLPLQI